SGRLRNDALYGKKAALHRKPREGAQSMPELFRRAGYRTVDIGKISHTPDGRVFAYDGTGDGRHELPGAWDELATPFGPWKRGWGSFFAYAGGAHREDGTGRRELSEFSVERDTDLPDGLMAQAATAKLAELADGDEPFFLGVGFFKPHLPFVAPAGDRAAFAEVEISDSEAPPLPSPYGASSGEFRGYRAGTRTAFPPSAEAALEAKRAYLACVRYVDRQVGAVLDALEAEGLAESTIVVIWGDHGWHLGESGVWGKHTLFDRSLRSTLLLRAPGVTKPGRRIRRLAATIDLYPTLMELCGLGNEPVDAPLDGVSLVPLLGASPTSVRSSVSSYWGKRASIRTAHHRLLATRAEAGGWRDVQLYRTKDGPDPLRSVAAEEPEVVSRLTGILSASEPR
ncbi:MAG: sulfatase-like hydrolase/transferase, partial [Planctomycetota bacterium]